MVLIQVHANTEENKYLQHIKIDLGLRSKAQVIEHLIQQSMQRWKNGNNKDLR